MTKTPYIDPELQAWIDPLSPAELARLEASLLEEGCRDPLVVWSDGCLLDGHNRYALCTKHGIAFQTVEKTGLVTKEDAMLWMIDNQLGRRNMTDFARVALALKRKPLLEERAKARMVAGKADPRLTSDEGPVRTDESIAKAAGVGRDTVRKVEMIIEKADAEVIAKVRTGELSINAAAKTVAQPKPPKVESENIDPEPKVATPRLPPEQSEVAVTQLDELLAEVADLKNALAGTLAENEEMGRVVDANDQVKAALVEAARYKALAENAERTLAARSHEFNDRARNVTYWKNRAEKAEKQLTKTKATGESSALRVENAQLREQLGDLAEQFQETLAEAEIMRKVIEADESLSEAMRKLSQAQELARVLETRLHGLTNEKNEILRRYKGAKHELDKLKQAHAKPCAGAATVMVSRAASPSGDADLISTELATLHAESDSLRAQLGDLVACFGESMVCHDEMREILEASVPLDEAPRQLQQALELARVLEDRVAEALRRHADVQCDQADITQATADETTAQVEDFVDLNGIEACDCQLSDDDLTQAAADVEREANPAAADVPEDDQQAAKSCNQ